MASRHVAQMVHVVVMVTESPLAVWLFSASQKSVSPRKSRRYAAVESLAAKRREVQLQPVK
jgi:hypothetical protein